MLILIPVSRLKISFRSLLQFALIACLASQSLAENKPAKRILRDARDAYEAGDYRRADQWLQRADQVIKPTDRALAIAAWDLRTEVLWASGRLQSALVVANRHRTALQKIYRANRRDLVLPMQNTLVRLGQINRALFEAQRAARRSQVVPDSELLRASAEMLREALAIPEGMRKTDPLWQAEVFLELGLVQELAGEKTDARRSLNLAVEQSRVIAADHSDPDLAVRAIGLIRNASARGDTQSNNRQARDALALASAALEGDRFALANRYDLFTMVAQCAQQLEDVELERTAIESILQIGSIEDRDVTSSNAKQMIRMAVLAANEEDGIAENGNAERWYRKAATAYRSLLVDLRDQQQASNDPQQPLLGKQVEYLQQLQLIYTRLEEWKQAITVVEQLLKIRSQLLVDDDPNRFRTLSALGSLHTKAARSAQWQSDYRTLRDHARAGETALNSAVLFWRKYALAEGVELATTLNNLAELARYSGRFRQANELLEEAAPLQTATSSPSDITLAEFHANRAAVLAALGSFQPAKSYYRRAMEGCRQNETDQRRRRQRLLATTLLNLAQLSKSQRLFQEASEECDAALEAAKLAWPNDNEVDRVPFMLAAASLRVAQRPDSHVLRKAIIQIEQALGILAEAGLGESLQAATGYHLLATAQYQLGLRKQAVVNWKSVINSNRSEYNVVIVRALNYLVANELLNVQQSRQRARKVESATDFEQERMASQESLASALQYCERAEELQKSMVAYPAVQFLTRFRRAQTLRAQAQIFRARGSDLQADDSQEMAITSLRDAIDDIESPRTLVVGADEERAEYFSQFAVGFDLLIDLLVEQKDYEAAIKVSERRRSRTFLDQMRASGVDPRATLPAESLYLLEKERETLDKYYEKSNQLLDPQIGVEERLALLAVVQDLRREWLETNTEIISASRAIRQLIHSSTSKSIAAVENAVVDSVLVSSLEPDAAALIYHIGARNSYLFIAQKNQAIRCFPLRLTEQQAINLGEQQGDLSAELATELVDLVLRGVVGGAYSEFRGASTVPTEAIKANNETLVNITDVLLPPEARACVLAEPLQYVLIVPDGPLHQLPLEALMVDGQSERYVLDDFPATCYAPSLAVFQLLAEEATSPADQLQILTVGDPAYPEATDSALQARQLNGIVGNDFLLLGGSLDPLGGTKLECEEVRRAFQTGAGHAVVVELLREDAAEQRVRAELEGKHVVHLAAHGLVDQRSNNLFGAIALSTPDRPTPEDDGFLSLYEIYLLPLQSCELAILSACKTNCGPRRPLEAGSTLARAFLCAGAKRVVCSHWSVDDQKTPILMKSFVTEVAREMQGATVVNYAEALHQARRKLRTSTGTADPRYWAPFVLVGPPYSESDQSR